MLKGIDPLLGPDLLAALASMGHGDEVVIVDANFPAVSVAAFTVLGRALRMDCDAPRAVAAVLSVLPVDEYEAEPVLTMQVVGAPDEVPPVVAEVLPLFTDHGTASLERFAFYARAKAGFAVIRTAETRPYGNFIIRKGVIN
ncbi:MAG: RbsD/FucU domain-containing protein [Paracoccus sp. (in: a-proteobacteria)]|nr:RbsD/FucU domain-containing protein [Paracoccus sp. (in: a-proteobacteria)]